MAVSDMEAVVNASLKPYNSFAIETNADRLLVVHSIAELQDACLQAAKDGLTLTILGGGTNVLIDDAGIPGLVIKNDISGIAYHQDGETVTATVGAGVTLDEFVADTVARGYWGLENLSHIPGSVGATPIQNVGAYGVEVADVIREVHTIHAATGDPRVFVNDECAFGYRDSFFKTAKGREYVVTEVVYTLSTAPRPQLSYAGLQQAFEGREPTQAEIRTTIIDIRSEKFPDWHRVGTAGSFFKNPIIENDVYEQLLVEYPDMPGFVVGSDSTKVPLGWILDRVCDLRDHRVGNVGTYKGQALVIVNYGGATSREVRAFADDVAQQVKTKTGIDIEWEVTSLP